MKKNLTLTLIALLAITIGASAQPQATQASKKDSSAFTFTTIKELPITSVKDQNRSGTCWDYSTLSFLESEILRVKGAKADTALFLSPMFVLWKNYSEKATKYVRMSGKLNFAIGGSSMDAIHAIKDYGIVPNCEMPGYFFGQPGPVSGEMDAVLKGYVDAVNANPNGKLSPIWHDGLDAVLDVYLGKCPEKFTCQGKEYTPKSYYESLGIDMDDYVSITSFAHHPWYSQFAIEVEDNWRSDSSYNVPIDDMVKIIYYAIDHGYTVAWASDVSESGFDRYGLGRIPDEDAVKKNMSGSDMARWLGLPRTARNEELARKMADPSVPEKVYNDEMRLEDFNDRQTTDDHGLHLYGTAKDQNGNPFFMVKNSWGKTGNYKGIWYVSEAYVRAKTMDIMVHKDAIPKDIRTKMGIK